MTSASPPSDDAVRGALRTVSARGELTREAARSALGAVFGGAATPAQIGALLMGIQVRGISAAEVTGFAEAMREAAVPLAPPVPGAVDVCGTGGDSSGTINISTGAGLIAAACGLKIAKHGNRSITSRSGSADILEALGIPIELPPEEARAAIEDPGFAFLFAPKYHPAMRHVGPVRRELGIRTVFNILGPLTNPAGVKRQLLGIFDDGLRPLVARVLRDLGSERVWVVHCPLASGGGLDEIGLCGPTRVSALEDGEIREMEIAPEDADLAHHPLEALQGGDAAHNAVRILAALSGAQGADRDSIVLNAAAALLVGGLARDLREGAALAQEAIDSGRARRLVEELRRPR